jgi:hypothetical protein
MQRNSGDEDSLGIVKTPQRLTGIAIINWTKPISNISNSPGFHPGLLYNALSGHVCVGDPTVPGIISIQ